MYILCSLHDELTCGGGRGRLHDGLTGGQYDVTLLFCRCV